MYANLFTGNLESFGDAFVTRQPPAPLTLAGARLRDPAVVDDLLDRFAAASGCRDRRATATQWSKYFFSRLGIAVTVVQLATGRALDVSLDRLCITWQNDGLPLHFTGHQLNLSAPFDSADFSSLLDDAFTPLVDTLCSCCRLSPRIFASNAAVYYDWALSELRAQQRIPEGRMAAAEALLHTPHRGQRRNFFYAPYKSCAPGALDGDGEPVSRCRRLCCVRDLDAKWGLCANCPRAIQYAPAAAGAG